MVERLFDKFDSARLALARKSGYRVVVKKRSARVRLRELARDMTRTCLSKSDTSFRRRATLAALSFKTSI